jgi:hypothetical protein
MKLNVVNLHSILQPLVVKLDFQPHQSFSVVSTYKKYTSVLKVPIYDMLYFI